MRDVSDSPLTAFRIAPHNPRLLVRLVAGPLCDQFGPRKVFGGLLLVGSIPLGLAPLIHNATGLYVSRFFIGILGGSFVPCQVWSTGFFDKNIVGTANALTGGFGNAGGGITYFIMPAVYDGLVAAGYIPSQAWRLTFLVPLAMVITTAIALIVLCPDTPTGKWADRHLHGEPYLDAQADFCNQGSPSDYGTATTDAEKASIIVDVPGLITDRPLTPDRKSPSSRPPSPDHGKSSIIAISIPVNFDSHPHLLNTTTTTRPPSTQIIHPPTDQPTATTTTTIQPPTLQTLLHTALTPQTAFHTLAYLCTFGAELAINSILAAYYAQRFPAALSQTAAANWAALFGFLNFVARPAGGAVSDLLYGYFGPSFSSSSSSSAARDGAGDREGRGLWWKKGWVVVCGVGAGVGMVVVGVVDGRKSEGGSMNAGGGEGVVIGLVTLVAVLLEAGNGANFSLLPHVHPRANGVLAGLTGAAGNLGGVLFAVVFRFMDGGTGYAKGFWVIGVVHLVVYAAVCWIPPLPRGQVDR